VRACVSWWRHRQEVTKAESVSFLKLFRGWSTTRARLGGSSQVCVRCLAAHEVEAVGQVGYEMGRPPDCGGAICVGNVPRSGRSRGKDGAE
jgi:hypothetical protein